MPSFRSTFLAYIGSVSAFAVGVVTVMDFNDTFRLTLFYIFSSIFLSWGILLLWSFLRPKVNIEIVSENWPDNSIQFKIWGEERELNINRKMVVTGYVIDPFGKNHSKKKTKYEYIIDGNDLKIGFHAKDFIARGNLNPEEIGDRGFMYFKTFIFSFIGGGRKKIRYIYSTISGTPLSFKKYLFVVYRYKKHNLIPRSDEF